MTEFQLIVLAAGKGSRITELTARKPKCLLPIGNRPMLYYPLKKIEKCGFREVFLVVLETAKSEVEFELEKTDLSIKINVVTIPCDADWGTADSLRHLSSYIISDFIVVSCDLLTTVNIRSILNFHRKNDASLTALYFEPSPHMDLSFTTPGPKSKNKPEKDLVGIDPSTNRLIFLASASDYEQELPLKRALLHKHGNIRICTNLLDAHFFIMKKWLIKYLTYDQNLSTVKGELIPFVLKKQLSLSNKLSVSNNTPVELTPVKDKPDETNIDLFSLARDPDYDITARSMSSFNDHHGDLCPTYLNDNIRCYSYIIQDFGLRTNTVRDFCKANRLVAENWDKLVGEKLTNVSSDAKVESTQFEKETCFVGGGTLISSKTSIKSSTFGSGCVIQSKSRISDCIIMNNVQIEEGSVLTNCIICDGVIIEENCVLKDCLIGSQYTIPANSSHNNEVLTKIENLMEI